jgi:cell division protease FtsH
MGHPGAPGSSVSDNVAHLIDEEIRAVIDRNYQRAETILQENIDILHKMADALMKWETIDRLQIEDLMTGKDPRPPAEDNDEQMSKPSEPGNDAPGNEAQDKTEKKVVNATTNKPAGQV